MPSSVIARYSYNTETQVLRVVFVSGMVYDYKNVPEAVYQAMGVDEGKPLDGRNAGHGHAKKGKKKKNKVWLHFLRHAFVRTASDKELKKL